MTRVRSPSIELKSSSSQTRETFPPLFSGRSQKAVYHTPKIAFFRGNPCLEALPPDISDKQLTRVLTNHIRVASRERTLAAHDRDQYIEHIPRFYHPLSKAYQIHRQLQRMIRGGYVGTGRNPAELQFWDHIDELAQTMEQDHQGVTTRQGDCADRDFSAYTGATAGSLIGVSGMGKSRLLRELLLKLFPQVIYHEAYGGRALPFQQVVWLYLECPNNASIRSMLQQIFWALDQILRTSYYARITRNGTVSADNLIVPMAKVCLAHGLGLLVIDEIQNVNQAASGGAQRMLNLFVKLINWVGIPVLLVGTPEAMEPLTAKFRMARRLSSQGDPKWDRMNRNDLDWEMFVEALWSHQYLFKPTPLTRDLRDALYTASAGITEVAIRVFMFAQRQAIAHALNRREECLTPELLTSIPSSQLGLMEPVLRALREGQEKKIERVNDVNMETPSVFKNEATVFTPQNNLNTRREGSARHNVPHCTNVLLAACSEPMSNISAYELLDRAGFIKPVSEFM